MQPTDKRCIVRIDGTGKAMGVAVIQITFKELGVLIDPIFLVFKEEIQTFLSVKNLLYNGFETSIRLRYVPLSTRLDLLVMKNYLLIYRWNSDNIPFALNTQ